jgi:hypothetical protein
MIGSLPVWFLVAFFNHLCQREFSQGRGLNSCYRFRTTPLKQLRSST